LGLLVLLSFGLLAFDAGRNVLRAGFARSALVDCGFDFRAVVRGLAMD
jgi:hypothetical protein